MWSAIIGIVVIAVYGIQGIAAHPGGGPSLCEVRAA
jgi:hypothetical protein